MDLEGRKQKLVGNSLSCVPNQKAMATKTTTVIQKVKCRVSSQMTSTAALATHHACSLFVEFVGFLMENHYI